MKSLASTLAGAASLSLLLFTGVPARGQELHTTYDQLKDEQRTFLIYIRDAENEYQNAIMRRGENNRLWQNNIMNSDLRLKVVFTLMDGNDKIPAHQSKIGALKKAFREAYWVNNFTTNYLALRNRAYELQNKLNPFIDQLDPKLKAWLREQGDAIRKSATPQAQAAPAIAETSNQTQLVNPTNSKSSSSTSGKKDLGGGFSYDAASGTVYGPDGRPIPGAKWDGSRIQLPNGYSVDPTTGTVYGPDGKVIPGATYGSDGKIHLPKGYWIDPATGTVYGPDNQPIPGAKVEDGKITKDGNTIADLNPTATPSNPTAPPSSDSNKTDVKIDQSKPVYVNGQLVTDIRELLTSDGTVKKEYLKAVYTDVKGGRLDSEVVLKNDPKVRADGGYDITQTEKDGTKISWAFGIKETDRKPSGQGFTATYQLVNAGTPPDAAFDITAWDGPDGHKETSDNSITVTFPKPGNYEVKAYGQTKQYGSKFTISQTVNF